MIDEHLRADPGKVAGADDPNGPGDTGAEAWAGCADVLCAAAPRLPRPAAEWRVRSLLGRYPGCLVAAVPLAAADGCLAGLRCGALLELLAPAASGPASGQSTGPARAERSWGELASLLHAWLVAGLPVALLHRAEIRTPAGAVRVRLLNSA